MPGGSWASAGDRPRACPMSGLLALHGLGLDGWSAERADRLLRAHSWRGQELVAGVERVNAEGARTLLRCVRDTWECAPGLAGEALVGAHGESVRVVADATLYDRDRLVERLRRAGVTPRSLAASDLVAAAWVAFGEGCVEHLEGDWAFVLHDAGSNALFAARDPFGSRSLFHRPVGEARFFASTPHPLAAATERPPPFDPEGVLRALWQQEGDGTRTGWLGIEELPAGTSLRVEVPGEEPRCTRFWHPRGESAWAALPAAEAPDTLARLLADACRVRTDPGGVALAMSGGQDSTAVLASLCRPEGPPVHVLSLRYPPGDPGNEDPYVEAAAGHMGVPIHWVETADQLLLAHEKSRAHQRSLPAGHAFESQNRALAAAARGLGVRVLMNGHGGDNLLWVSDWYMADLLRSGRFRAFRRAFRARGYRGVRQFVNYGLRPALPLRLYDRLGSLRRRPVAARPYQRPLPPWLRAEAELEARIREADRRHHDGAFETPYATVTGRKRAWGLGYAAFPRVCAALFDLMRDEGVELRMPYYDRRLVAFALARPPEEFNQPGEAKVLLRRAMRGRLPDLVVDPRPQGHKTGTAEGYFRPRFDREAPPRFQELFGSAGAGVTEAAGIVDPARLKRALDEVDRDFRRWDGSLLGTLHVEGWLQAQAARGLHKRMLPIGAGSGQ